jgi:hypothetical protein
MFKRKKRFLLILILFLSLLFFLYLPPIRFKPLPPSPPSGGSSGYLEYRGAVHAHSRYSDGRGTIEEVAQAAAGTGLDFVIITDHDTLTPLSDGKEGYYGDTLLLVGTELSTRHGHLVALDLAEPIFRFPFEADKALADVHEERGIAIAAHPDSEKVPWTNWALPVDGMELINTDCEWRNCSFSRLLSSFSYYPINPGYALLLTFSTPEENLKRWDEFTKKRRFIGSAGADAHGGIPLTDGFFIPFPGYRTIFSLVNLHLLSKEKLEGRIPHDKRVVYSALRGGNFYIGIDGLADARGFFFGASSGGEKGVMGDLLSFSEGAIIRALIPAPSPVKAVLLRDGEVIGTFSSSFNYQPQLPGSYRVEVYLADDCYPRGNIIPWIISNPIYLWDEERMKTRIKTFPVSSPDVDRYHLMIEDFEGEPKTDLGLEHDPSSSEEGVVVEGGAHSKSRRSFRLRFRLAPVTEESKHVMCAISNRVFRDLSPYSGISFFVKGDGTYRFLFQLREYDRKGEERVEVFGTSVKVRPYWERKVIPFSSLILLSKEINGIMEPARCAGFFFILNEETIKPGTSGTIWFDDISLVK